MRATISLRCVSCEMSRFPTMSRSRLPAALWLRWLKWGSFWRRYSDGWRAKHADLMAIGNPKHIAKIQASDKGRKSMKRRNMIHMNEEEIRELLEEQRTVQLATLDHDGWPH